MPQSELTEGFTMKKLIVIVLVGCALVINPGFQKVAPADGFAGSEEGTSLHKLAGTYAFTGHGSVAVCLDQQTFSLVQCGTAGSIVVAFTSQAVGGQTFDAKGNSCATFTETEVSSPVGASPTTVVEFHSVGKVTSYDPTTGTGDASFTNYSGGKCKDSTFDSTGATVTVSGTNHFAVSNSGKRIDFVTTSLSLTTPVVGAIGGFSISFTALRD